MNNITILSPSWKRAKTACTHKAVNNLRYVVCEAQADDYAKRKLPLLVCPDSAQGSTSRIRNWILDNSPTENLVITDDDISSFGRWDGNTKNRMKPEEVNDFIESGFLLAEEWGCRYWGMNLLPDKGMCHEFRPFSLHNAILGPFGGFRLPLPIRYPENLPLKEDYDFSLQVLNKYRRILRFNYVHYNAAQHTNLGGCADFRNIQQELEQARLLQKRWGPEIVKIEYGDKKKKGQKKEAHYDINPLIRVPIGGI